MHPSDPITGHVAASRLQLPPGDWRCLLDGLCARFPRIDRGQWQDRFARGRVRDAQGRALAAEHPWQVGLEIHYFREVADEPVIPHQEAIVHVDAHLLVARTGNPDLVPLHRLDRLTAGLVLFSTCTETRDAYQRLFRERRIVKTYEAIAPGLPGRAFPLERHSRLVPGEPFFRMTEAPGEPNARTRVEVIDAAGPFWRYRLHPETGRKHQLRVHMAALGAPICGDDLYPELNPAGPGAAAPVLQLLAKALAFEDPLTGEPRQFSSGLDL